MRKGARLTELLEYFVEDSAALVRIGACAGLLSLEQFFDDRAYAVDARCRQIIAVILLPELLQELLRLARGDLPPRGLRYSAHRRLAASAPPAVRRRGVAAAAASAPPLWRAFGVAA